MDKQYILLEARIKDLENKYNNVDKTTALLGQKLDAILKSVDDLTDAIKQSNLEEHEKIRQLEQKVEELKRELDERTTGKDAEKWNSIIKTIITGIATALVGLFIGLFAK